MLLKIGTNYSPHEELLPLLEGAHQVFKRFDKLMVITSLKDREHSPGSQHYIGKAFDLRKKHIKDPDDIEQINQALQQMVMRHNGLVIEKHSHWHIQVKK
jgi:hypothetical protein